MTRINRWRASWSFPMLECQYMKFRQCHIASDPCDKLCVGRDTLADASSPWSFTRAAVPDRFGSNVTGGHKRVMDVDPVTNITNLGAFGAGPMDTTRRGHIPQSEWAGRWRLKCLWTRAEHGVLAQARLARPYLASGFAGGREFRTTRSKGTKDAPRPRA